MPDPNVHRLGLRGWTNPGRDAAGAVCGSICAASHAVCRHKSHKIKPRKVNGMLVIKSCEPHGIVSNATEMDTRQFAGKYPMWELNRTKRRSALPSVRPCVARQP